MRLDYFSDVFTPADLPSEHLPGVTPQPPRRGRRPATCSGRGATTLLYQRNETFNSDCELGALRRHAKTDAVLEPTANVRRRYYVVDEQQYA
jgi:hypothetical protein